MFTICDFPENSSSFQHNYANYFLNITMHIFTTGQLNKTELIQYSNVLMTSILFYFFSPMIGSLRIHYYIWLCRNGVNVFM